MTAAWNDANAINFDYSEAVKDLSGNSTTGQLTWTTYGGTAGNFNIADTAFYKKAAVKSAKTEAGGTSAGSRVLVTFLDDTTKTYDSNTLSLSGNSVVQKNSAGTQVASYDLSSYYTSAYNTGWNACRNAATAHTITKYSRTTRTLYLKNADGTYSATTTTYYYQNGTTTSGYDLPAAKFIYKGEKGL